MKLQFILLIAILFSGCNYSESKTTTSKVDTSSGINVNHSNSKEQTVTIGDKTFKANTDFNVISDGTPQGTKADINVDFATPVKQIEGEATAALGSVTTSIQSSIDLAKAYTISEGQALYDTMIEDSKAMIESVKSSIYLTLSDLLTENNETVSN